MPTTKNNTQHIAICVLATNATCRTRESIEIYAAHVCAFVFERVPTVPAAARQTRARVPISHINEICPGRGAGTELAFNYIIKQLRESIQPMPRSICPHTHTRRVQSPPRSSVHNRIMCRVRTRVPCVRKFCLHNRQRKARARARVQQPPETCVREAEPTGAEQRRAASRIRTPDSAGQRVSRAKQHNTNNKYQLQQPESSGVPAYANATHIFWRLRWFGRAVGGHCPRTRRRADGIRDFGLRACALTLT